MRPRPARAHCRLSPRTRRLVSEGGGCAGAKALCARVAGTEAPSTPLPTGLICDSGLAVPLTTPCASVRLHLRRTAQLPDLKSKQRGCQETRMRKCKRNL